MEYSGKSYNVRVMIVATNGPWAKYNGQMCDAIFYEEGMNAHINTEQLKPPCPKWQQAKPSDLEQIKAT